MKFRLKKGSWFVLFLILTGLYGVTGHASEVGMGAAARPLAAQSASLKMSTSSMTLYKPGKTSGTIKVTVKGKSQKITWKTSNKKVATVKGGKVTAVGTGKCKITASANSISKSCTVTVKASSLKLSKSSLTLKIGKNATLKATVAGPSQKVTWKTSNKKVAVVEDGEVTAVGSGKCKITATANGIRKSCTITVKKAPSAVAVSCGVYHTAVLKKDGSLWVAGRNDAGQLGDGNQWHDRSEFFELMSGVASVSCGSNHTAILKKDGTLWMCGFNFYGQLGDGTNKDKATPVKIMSGVAAVDCGDWFTAILKKDGTLWMTGYNDSGQLGDGTKTWKNKPVKVMSGVAAVSCGAGHTAILKKDGTLWMTGYNDNGEMGNGTSSLYSVLTPIKVMSGVAQASCGADHTAILKKDGTLWTTGWNYWGQLGDGTAGQEEYKLSPVLVMDGVASVNCGSNNTAILKKDGTLWMTGYNWKGQLGDGTMTDRSTPVKVLSNVTSFCCGSFFSAAVKKDGTLWMSGFNTYGQFGNGKDENSYKFVKVM